MEMQKLGYTTAATQTFETVYAVMEWVFRLLFILVCLLQAIIRGSSTGKYCISEGDQLLKEEGKWLGWLIVVQSVKIVIMSVWHIMLNRRNKGFFQDQTFSDWTSSSYSFYDQSSTSMSLSGATQDSRILARKKMHEDDHSKKQVGKKGDR